MRGLLFYDTVGAERNKWFIGRLIEVAEERGCELHLVIAPDEVEDALASDFDFAIVRTISPQLNKRLEELSIPTFNKRISKRWPCTLAFQLRRLSLFWRCLEGRM